MMDNYLTFRAYQRQAIQTNRVKDKGTDLMFVPLLGLAGEAGSLLSEYKKWLREGDRYRPFADQVAEELGDLLWYLANIAENEGLDLQEIAAENLAKIADRYHAEKTDHTPLFGPDRYDASYPLTEQLPLSLSVQFEEIVNDGRIKIVTTIGELPFGDKLTDNSHLDDGYRYHDVFHFTFAILLGWSPIVRRALGMKRKSVPKVDEVEDGARAAIIEEAISAVIFGHAKDYSFFEGSNTVEFSLLRTIKQMTAPLEVRTISLRQWEIAILKSYEVWRQMVANRGGIFIGDTKSQTVQYLAKPAQN
jgi:NTP pyrophosphatase (non-canonical NTP hydrolase)